MRRRQFAAPFVLVLATGAADAGPISKPSKCQIASDFKCPLRAKGKGPTCNPLPPKYHPMYEATILKREREDDRVVLFVAIGSNSGITKQWKVALVTEKGAVVPSKTTLLKLGSSTAVVVGPPLSDEVYDNVRVRFTAC